MADGRLTPSLYPYTPRWVVVAVSGRQAEYLTLDPRPRWQQLPDLLEEHSYPASVGMTGRNLVVAGGFSRQPLTHVISVESPQKAKSVQKYLN